MLQERLERLIQSAERGDATSHEELFTVLYHELHRLAQRELHRGALLTKSPTTLLHETYLNLRNHLPAHAQDIYREAFNHAFAAHAGDPRQEEAANRIAWAAVKRRYTKEGSEWVAHT